MSYITFADALSYSFIKHTGGVEINNVLTGEDFASFSGSVFIASPREGLLILPGDNVPEYQVSFQVSMLQHMMEQGRLPGKWKSLVILYVFTDPIPENLARAIPRHVYRSYIPSRFVGAGYVDMTSGRMRILEDLNISSTLEITRQVIQAYQQEQLDDMELYRASVDVTSRRFLTFSRRMADTFPYVTWAIIALWIAMFTWLVFSGGNDKTVSILRFGAMSASLINQGEWWRIFGSMFLHLGFLHLVLNIFAMIILGAPLERYLGNVRFMALFSIAGIFGALFSITTETIAASVSTGIIFGFIGAALIIGMKHRSGIPSRLRDHILGSITAVSIFSFFFSFTVQGIDGTTLFGGLLAGLLFALIIPPEPLDEQEDDGESQVEDEIQPVTRRPWFASPVTLVLLGLIALAPFVIQTYVVYRAAVHTTLLAFPRKEYRDPGNRFYFRYPAFLRVRTSDHDRFLNSYQFSFHTSVVNIGKVTQVNEESGDNLRYLIDKTREELTQQFEGRYAISITDYHIKTIGKQRWLLLDALVFGPENDILHARFALTTRMSMMYRVEMYTTSRDLEDAQQVMEIIVESFKPIFP